ncbi:MAG: hypothetical protein D5R97_07875 [Candidatus Syntrophonatronum acetioxidans]|uniref:Uncharacterized protein n=1 Tax=Candidatus Syntrophonatronum acetioxidans TaxID=1795816 RepID=A0A424YBI1_9FIRM|nr:MAG: hypothetical protein D5R97_07875 [Candidatus Syntrophonatronum acetioxidans]
MPYVFIFLVIFGILIFAIRILLHKEHRTAAQLPIFKSNYIQGVCIKDDCPLNEKQYYPPEKHNRMLILIHKLSLRSEDLEPGALKCPWCEGPLKLEPLGPLFKYPPPGEEAIKLPWENK